MTTLKLALRNLLGAGLRTWLNVFALSFAYLAIIFLNGLMDGWQKQAKKDTIEWEYGKGQLWHHKYDPYDPFSLKEAHSIIPEGITGAPILITQASIYPEGRMMSVQLKGIKSDQNIINIPSSKLQYSEDNIPIAIGTQMSETTGLKIGDKTIIRWRDVNGTFDAIQVEVIEIFNNTVPSTDNGQVWIGLEQLQKMMNLKSEATIIVLSTNKSISSTDEWVYKDLDFLLMDIDNMIEAKKAGNSIIYILLLVLALLAVFDTQVLSVFRRQKEIGTYIALGMTRWKVVMLFTIEGGFNSILAAILAFAYGAPILYLVNKAGGIPMVADASEVGMSIADSLIPSYTISLILSTVLIVVICATIVSFIPARKIAKMKPTDALKGKIQ